MHSYAKTNSVISSFDESDMRAATNVLQHRFFVLYKVRANTVASFTWWHGRTLNPNLQNAALGGGIKPGEGSCDPLANLLPVRFDLHLLDLIDLTMGAGDSSGAFFFGL